MARIPPRMLLFLPNNQAKKPVADNPSEDDDLCLPLQIELVEAPDRDPAELAHLVAAYAELIRVNPPKRAVEENQILATLMFYSDVTLVTFFSCLFDIKLQRDSFSKQRKALAAAALSTLALNGSREARAALVRAARHSNRTVAQQGRMALELIDDPIGI